MGRRWRTGGRRSVDGGPASNGAAVDGQGSAANELSTEGRQRRAGAEVTVGGGRTGRRPRACNGRGGGKAAVDEEGTADVPSTEGRRRRAIDGGPSTEGRQRAVDEGRRRGDRGRRADGPSTEGPQWTGRRQGCGGWRVNSRRAVDGRPSTEGHRRRAIDGEPSTEGRRRAVDEGRRRGDRGRRADGRSKRAGIGRGGGKAAVNGGPVADGPSTRRLRAGDEATVDGG